MDSKIQIIIKQNNVTTNRAVLESAQKASITATNNMQISLLNAETSEPITKLQAKKSGNNLLIADESGDELLTIEDYYVVENIEVGTIKDSGFAKFNAVNPENGETISSVSETLYTPLVAEMLDDALNINTATTTAISSSAFWGGLGAVAIGAAIINDDDDDNSTQIDRIAPSSLTQELGADNQTITGETEAGAKVTATYNGKVLGTAVAKEDGSYTLNLDKAYVNGEAIEVTAVDESGNATDPNTVTAPDITAPSNLTQEISADGTVVSGKTEAGAIVTIAHNGKVLGEVETDLSGIYKVELDEKFAGGEELLITAKDAKGNATEPNIIVAPDNTAPNSLTQKLGEDNRTITGETEKGAKVTATYNGKVVGTAVAKEDGSYTLNLDKAYANGEAIEITAADATGNTTEPNTVTAPDTIAPSSLNQEISKDGTVVNGTTEAGATVTVTHNGEVVGTAVAKQDGSYSLSLDPAFKNGEALEVTAKDTTGNITEPNVLTAPDITAPSNLTQELGADNQTITGETEASAKVTATYNGNVVGTAVAKEDGSYTLNLDKAYANGEAIEITAADATGNTTVPGNIYASISEFETKSLELDLISQFETRIEAEQQTVVDKSSYGWLNEYFSFEVTGSNASLQLDLINPNRVINAQYQISLNGPGLSSSKSGSINSIGSSIYPIDLDTGALTPGSYTMDMRVNASGSNIKFNVKEYVDVEYQDFAGYNKVSGSIFGSEGSPENYELKIDGQSLVYKVNDQVINSLTLVTENGVLDLKADGFYTYTSKRTEGGLGVSELKDSFDIEVFDLNGESSGTVGIDIIPNVDYGNQFVNFDGEALVGSQGNDTLVADEFTREMKGDLGDDSYIVSLDVLEAGDSYIVINDNSGQNSLKYKGVNPAQIEVLSEGDSISLMLGAYDVTLIDQSIGKGVENIYFDSGEVWNRTDIEYMINGSVI